MNERIRQLAEQNFYYGTWEGDGIFTGQVDLEKFAESIVRECADIALREEHDPYECIKKHFGVEE